MVNRRRKWTVSGCLAALMGFAGALVLAGMFYGAMVYQLAGEEAPAPRAVQAAGGALGLHAGTLTGETRTQEEVGGALCSVLTRSYQLEDGTQARAVTASPAAYLERLGGEDVQMQPITGFVIDGLDAVYAHAGQSGVLAAREGDTVYMVLGPQDQQTLYALGAGARREGAREAP